MNTNDEELKKMLDLIYSVESNTSDDNDPRIESVKSLFKQLKEENDLLKAQKETREAGYSEGKYWAPFILLDALE